MKNVSAHSATSPANWLVNPFTDWKANLVSAIQNGTRALFVCAALIVVLTFALPLAAQAQNNSAYPYINSTHRYRVAKGADGNTVSWSLQNPSGTNVEIGAWGVPDVTIKNEAPDSAYIDITFVNTVFAAPSGEWTLIYSEESALTGACVARRSVTFTPTTNDFKLSLAADDTNCNSFAGHVWDNTDDLTATRSLAVPFTVTMNKNTNHAVKVWSFDGKITVDVASGFTVPAAASFITVISGSSTLGGTYTISSVGNDGTFTITVPIPDVSSNATTDEVELTVNISGNITVDVGVTLTISNAVARSGTHYTVVTDDTGTPDEHKQTRTLWGIPNTSVISVSAN